MLGLFIYGLTTQTSQVSLVAGFLVAGCLVWGVLARLTLKGGYFTDERDVHEA